MTQQAKANLTNILLTIISIILTIVVPLLVITIAKLDTMNTATIKHTEQIYNLQQADSRHEKDINDLKEDFKSKQ